jgi:hypothetical protein
MDYLKQEMDERILLQCSKIERLLDSDNFLEGELHLEISKANGYLINEYLLDRIPIKANILNKLRELNFMLRSRCLPYRLRLE